MKENAKIGRMRERLMEFHAHDPEACLFASLLRQIVTLCIMLRKKHKKRSKGWRDHPPSWFYSYQGLFKLYSLKSGIPGLV